MTVLSCRQLAPQIGDVEQNIAAAADALADAVAEGADIVVLPELATSGYRFFDANEARAAALPVDSALFGQWVQALGDSTTVVIAGFAERGADGLVYNSAMVFDRDATLGVYRKTHLWDAEKRVFTAGDEPPPVIATRHGSVGVLICYDAEFPELTRHITLAGADLLAVPTNWPLVERPADEHPPEVIIAMAAARVNRLPIALCDRTGDERGQQWTAASTIIDERGWIVAATPLGGQSPAAASADVDLSIGRDKRHTVLAHALLDRRPELYTALLAVGE